MIKNYLILAWRHLTKNKGYTFINIAGLSTGMAIALLISLWITDEMSYDHYHKDYRRIAQALTVQRSANGTKVGYAVSMPMAQAIREQYHDIFSKVALCYNVDDQLVSVGDRQLITSGLWAQKEFADIYTYKMLKGTTQSMADPSTMLISQSLATALFGSADPIGQTIRYQNQLDLKVGGVYEDLPKNTSYYGTKMLLPWDNQWNSYHLTNTSWWDHNAQLYVQLAPGVTAEQATARVAHLPTSRIREWEETTLLYPLDKFRLYGDFEDGKPVDGGIKYVWMFGIIGVFVLLLACINFMNLSTARSERRAKEVGIRKTVGSLRQQLIAQFLIESILLAAIASVFSLLLVEITLPFFDQLSGKDMSLPWNSWLFWSLTIAFTLFTGLLAGSYPAFYLSHFDPVRVLKGSFRAGRFSTLPRQALVVLQFSVSLTLIIGTTIIYRQIQYTKDRPLGYQQDRLVTVDINTPELRQHYNALRNELLERGLAENVAGSSMTVMGFWYHNAVDWPGKRPDQQATLFCNVNVTPEFGKTIGWQVIQGRDFDRSRKMDSASVVLNETAAKAIGIPNLIGQKVQYDNKSWTVIGVVRDMVVNWPYGKPQPAIFLGDGWATVINMRLPAGRSARATLEAMAPIFKKYNPGSPFTYHFMSEEFSKKFEEETRIGHLATVFAGLAIFISCLGLFGLASFVAEQRTKEIGVRKVLGAGLFTLWRLLSSSFIRLVLLSFFIAMPLSYLFMTKWLQNYPYHTTLTWWIFALSGATLLLITLATVSYQSLKAATMNPIKSLRSE